MFVILKVDQRMLINLDQNYYQIMDCQHVMYKPIRTSGPYDRFIAKQRQKQITQKKQIFYAQIFKFTESRYPKQFLLELEKEINPFEHSLDTLRNVILKKYPDLPEDVVNQSVDYVFGKKSREALMIKQSETVIQDGDQFIRNGRKLIKEDFTYNFQRPLNDTLPPQTQRSYSGYNRSPRGDQTKRSNTSRRERDSPEGLRRRTSQYQYQPPQTDRPPLSSTRKNGLNMSKNELFNQFIAEQIKKQSIKHKNIDIIYQDDPDDILVKYQFTKKAGFTDRSKSGLNNSFSEFKQRDVIVPVQGGMQTGRSEMEELNRLLSDVSMKCEEKEGMTERSDRGMYMMKINKKNMDNLYNMQGTLKMDAIKRAANRMLTEYA